MHIQIIFIGNNIPENNSEAPLLGLAKSIYYDTQLKTALRLIVKSSSCVIQLSTLKGTMCFLRLNTLTDTKSALPQSRKNKSQATLSFLYGGPSQGVKYLHETTPRFGLLESSRNQHSLEMLYARRKKKLHKNIFLSH